MYKLEITTNDQRETLIFSEKIETWEEVKKEIDYFKKLRFENIYLMIYKENKENELDYLGEFYNIESKEQYLIKKKKNNLTNKIIILEILLFPIMLIKEIIKEK